MRTLHVPALSVLEPSVLPVRIDVRPFALEGKLVLPTEWRGAIILAGAASSGLGAPSGALADNLQGAGFAVLLLDLLLSPSSHLKADLSRFETALLSARIIVATDWLTGRADLGGSRVGCLGFGPAGAAAVIAASERPASIAAVVAADPRLDAAEAALLSLASPLLMITGTRDKEGAASAQRAMTNTGAGQMQIRPIPGGFGELSAGRISEIGRLARQWYERYLC